MPIGENLPVESIEQLAAELKRQAGSLETTITALRTSCQKDPNFIGNAADKYEGFMTRWASSQHTMIENINGAGDLLTQYAAKLRELGLQVGGAFDV